MNIKSISIDEFLQRIGSQPNGNIWSVLVTSNLDNSKLAEELEETLTIFTECEVGIISADNVVDNVVNEIQQASEEYLIIWNFENWDNHHWRKFDQMRSRLIKQRGVVLVLSEKIVNKMFVDAPNLVSWIGACVYEFIEDSEFLTEEERQMRVVELQQWSGYSDAQVLELAESEQLPPDPEYGEWLVLLNREDLIGR